MRHANEALEARVAERTAELEAMNVKLRAQVAHLRLLDQTTQAIAERQDLRSIFQTVLSSIEEHLLIDCDTQLTQCLTGELVYEPDIENSASPTHARLREAGMRSVVSMPGKGTTMRLLFATAQGAAALSGEGAMQRARPPRILIIDDDPLLLLLLGARHARGRRPRRHGGKTAASPASTRSHPRRRAELRQVLRELGRSRANQ